MILRKDESRYEIDYSRKVFVYKNLHKDCWSVKQDGLVKAHSSEEDILLYETQLVVNRKGRERVLKEKKKNVHAGVKGYLSPPISEYNTWTEGHVDFKTVTYNPYNESFVYISTEKPLYFSPFVRMKQNSVLAA